MSSGMKVLCEAAYSSVVSAHLQRRLLGKGKGRFDISILEQMQSAIDKVYMPFLGMLIASSTDYATGEDHAIQQMQWKSRLSLRLAEQLGSLRTKELFDIIKEFPDSSPAVQDLRECLKVAGGQRALVDTFKVRSTHHLSQSFVCGRVH